MKSSAIAAILLFFSTALAPCILAHGQNVPAALKSPRDSEKTFLIITTEVLKPVAHEWAEYRKSHQGGRWHAVVHMVPKVAASLGLRESIRDAIDVEYAQAPSKSPEDFAVLLLGDAEPDRDIANGSAADIPAWYFAQHDSAMQSHDGRNDFYASDHPYQVMKTIGGSQKIHSPDIPLGRVPARTIEEARTVLHKIQSYEKPPTLESFAASQRTHIAYTAGEGRYGGMDDVLETLFKSMVDRMVPNAFEISMIYAKPSSIYCPPPSRLTEFVLDQLNDRPLLFNYVGHGFEKGFDSLHWRGGQFPILDVSDVQQAANAIQSSADDHSLLPIGFFSCCSAGWFDLPNAEHSLAEAMLLTPAQGCIAIIAGSRITHPYANTVMQMNITKSLLVDRSLTVGLLHFRAVRGMVKSGAIDRQLDSIAAPIARAGQWETSLHDLRKTHTQLYNLLGDPATRITFPEPISSLTVNEHSVTGSVPKMKNGRVVVTFETERTSMAQPELVRHPTGRSDVDLEAKAAVNASLVNNRVLSRSEGEVRDGQFSISTTSAVPASASVMRAYAIGLNELGVAMDAVGAATIASP